jgi:predicted NUDIX family NTP pyrophosphohydrolase
MYRRCNPQLEVFLIHPGGPYWFNKDLGVWSIPKGEYTEEEHAIDAALREFVEETGFQPNAPFLELGDVRQPGGKLVTAWAFEGDGNPKDLRSNTFSIEWPPRSGRHVEFPEVDRGAWYTIAAARVRINKGQVAFLDRLVNLMDHESLPTTKTNP